MATSHYCHGKWRDGTVESCPHHNKLSKKQTNVYRGIGEPGGRNGKAPPSDQPAEKPKEPAKTAPPKSSGD